MDESLDLKQRKSLFCKLYFGFVFFSFGLVYTLLTVVMGIVWIPMKLLFFPDRVIRGWGWFIARRIAGSFNFLLGEKVKVLGLENIAKAKGDRVCFYSNHTSMLDITTILTKFGTRMGFIAKKSLSRIPLFWVYVRIAYCVLIDRDSIHSNIAAIRDGVNNIERGVRMLIFPEGTRSKTGELGEFKKGAMKLATRSGAVVIPVAIVGLRKFLEGRKRAFIRRTAGYVSILPPIDVAALSDAVSESLADMLSGKIGAEIERLKGLS